jgi:hypothetical protein
MTSDRFLRWLLAVVITVGALVVVAVLVALVLAFR